MNASEYQKQAARTLISKPGFEIATEQWDLIWHTVMLCASSGKVAELVKKGIFHQHGLDEKRLNQALWDTSDTINDIFYMKSADAPQLTDRQTMLVWCLIGLLGEAGEIAEMIVDSVFEMNGQPDKADLTKELGDLEWYTAGIGTVEGIDLGEVMTLNIEKLWLRYKNGFSSGDSIKRVDVELA